MRELTSEDNEIKKEKLKAKGQKKQHEEKWDDSGCSDQIISPRLFLHIFRSISTYAAEM
jgi:hypothetical protein